MANIFIVKRYFRGWSSHTETSIVAKKTEQAAVEIVNELNELNATRDYPDEDDRVKYWYEVLKLED